MSSDSSASNPDHGHDPAMAVMAELGRRRQPKPLEPDPRSRRIKQAVKGLAWFATIAGIISNLTQTAYVVVFVVLLAVALSCGVLGVVWMARSRLDSPHRFSIATLLFATLYVGLFFGSVRWLVTASMAVLGVRDLLALDFLIPAIVWLLICMASTPMVFGLLDSLIWLAAWLVRRPQVRRWLAARSRR